MTKKLVPTLIRITEDQMLALKKRDDLSLAEHIRRALDIYLAREIKLEGLEKVEIHLHKSGL